VQHRVELDLALDEHGQVARRRRDAVRVEADRIGAASAFDACEAPRTSNERTSARGDARLTAGAVPCGAARRLARRCDGVQIAVMAASTITICDVPQDVRDVLEARAASKGRSLEDHLRIVLIELARRATSDDVLSRARERSVTAGARLDASAILGHRDAGRDAGARRRRRIGDDL
jgi:plasmid stability protein